MDALFIVSIVIGSILLLFLVLCGIACFIDWFDVYMAPRERIRRLHTKSRQYRCKCEDKIAKIEEKEQFKDNLEYLQKHDLLEEFLNKQDIIKKKK